MNRFIAGIVLILLTLHAESVASAAHKPRKIVVMVWDGMRPDFVTEAQTPNLFKLANSGVTFLNHHPVYISSTEVNGAALATGDYPCHNRIIANKEYRSGIDPLKAVATESLTTVRAAGNQYLGAKTIAEILHDKGISTAVAGTKAVVILQDPSDERPNDAARNSVNLIAGKTIPPEALNNIIQEQGPFPPEVTFPNSAEDNWTTQALIQTLWKNEVPTFSLLWMSDPDFSQHQSAPGSELALAAIKSNDERLGLVLDALDSKGGRADTDIFVVSDHGFSTTGKTLDIQKILTTAGFRVSNGEFKTPPKSGDILMVTLGGTLMFYIIDHDEAVTHQLIDFLQQSDFAGVIFSKTPAAGVFGLDQIRLNSPESPDVVLALHWSDQKNQYGVQGQFDSDKKAGKGMHASLARFDMHNTLIAAGPDFKKGYSDSIPTGNIDVAPTILKILGITAPEPMDGRVLTEALVQGSELPTVKNVTLESKRDLEKSGWHQYLKISQVGETLYFNEGNGEVVPK